jgi:hypothetical protein
MGKKYLETKESSLESSILGVWENAVSETVERAKANLDARTKEYKIHQERLAASRLRRENSKKLTKEEFELDEEITEEESALFELDDEEFDEAMKKKSSADRLKAKKKRDKYMKTGAGKAAAKKAKKRAAKVRSGSIKIDPAKSRAAKKRAKLYSGDEFSESFEIGTNEYRDHALKVTPGETDPEWEQARDFKVASMKEALAKVWGMEEGNNPFIKKEDDDKALTKGGKNGTTMTGKKAAIIDTKPKIKD